MRYFTTSQEVERFLPSVFWVHLRKDISALGYTKKSPDGMCIEIKSSERFKLPDSPWEMTDLEWQQTTFLHELCHVQDMVEGRHGSWAGWLPHPWIDEHTYMLLKTCPVIVDEIMYRLMRKDIQFHYDEETPFLEYHRELVRRHLRADPSPTLLLAPTRPVMVKYGKQLESPGLIPNTK